MKVSRWRWAAGFLIFDESQNWEGEAAARATPRQRATAVSTVFIFRTRPTRPWHTERSFGSPGGLAFSVLLRSERGRMTQNDIWKAIGIVLAAVAMVLVVAWRRRAQAKF